MIRMQMKGDFQPLTKNKSSSNFLKVFLKVALVVALIVVFLGIVFFRESNNEDQEPKGKIPKLRRRGQLRISPQLQNEFLAAIQLQAYQKHPKGLLKTRKIDKLAQDINTRNSERFDDYFSFAVLPIETKLFKDPKTGWKMLHAKKITLRKYSTFFLKFSQETKNKVTSDEIEFTQSFQGQGPAQGAYYGQVKADRAVSALKSRKIRLKACMKHLSFKKCPEVTEACSVIRKYGKGFDRSKVKKGSFAAIYFEVDDDYCGVRAFLGGVYTKQDLESISATNGGR